MEFSPGEGTSIDNYGRELDDTHFQLVDFFNILLNLSDLIFLQMDSVFLYYIQFPRKWN